MAPTSPFIRPYLMQIGRLTIRDENINNQDSVDGPAGTPEYNTPEAFPDYTYPGWGIAVGTLCVALCCVAFSFLCAFLNRRSNKQAAFLAEFPCLGSKTHLAGGLATSTCAIPTALALSKYADAFGPATLAAEKTSAIGTRQPFGFVNRMQMPRQVTRVLHKVGRRKAQNESVNGVPVGIDIVELKPVDLTSTVLDSKEEGTKKAKDGEVFDWNRPEVKHEEGALERPAPAIVPSSADVNADVDAIAFVTEERFENVDLK